MMHRRTSSDVQITSPRSSRAASFSSERPSLLAVQIPTSAVNPAPCYVALGAASQLLAKHYAARLQSRHAEEESASSSLPRPPQAAASNVLFSSDALHLLNAFLDHLLYSFLSAARSTSLVALRPAVFEVLKQRLGRDAVASAEEELQGLLANADEDEELAALPNGEDPQALATKWDLDTVWRRTRLRVMVYISLGELEDEDEDRYLEQDESLRQDADNTHFSYSGLFSWASAIFLTHVTEYIAEHTLLAAGQAASDRAERRRRQLQTSATSTPIEKAKLPRDDRIVLEESDMEKVAYSPTLGRLWRSWRKRSRTTPLLAAGGLASPTRENIRMAFPNALTGRRSSFETADGSGHSVEGADGLDSSMRDSLHGHQLLPEMEPSETDIAANIPLPVSENDELDNAANDDDQLARHHSSATEQQLARPRSASNGQPWSLSSRGRSSSLPNLTALPPLSVYSRLTRDALIAASFVAPSRGKSAKESDDEANVYETTEITGAPSQDTLAHLPSARGLHPLERKVLTTEDEAVDHEVADEEATQVADDSAPIPLADGTTAHGAAEARSNVGAKRHSAQVPSVASRTSSVRTFTIEEPEDCAIPIMKPAIPRDPVTILSSSEKEESNDNYGAQLPSTPPPHTPPPDIYHHHQHHHHHHQQQYDDIALEPSSIGTARTTDKAIPVKPLPAMMQPSLAFQKALAAATPSSEQDRMSIDSRSDKRLAINELRSSRHTGDASETYSLDSDLSTQVQRPDSFPVAPISKAGVLEALSEARTNPEPLQQGYTVVNNAMPGQFPVETHELTHTTPTRKQSKSLTSSPVSGSARLEDRANVQLISPAPVVAVPPEGVKAVPSSDVNTIDRLRRMSSGRRSLEAQQLDFDELVRSEQTFKYTLTPPTVREIEEKAAAQRTPPVTKVTVYPPTTATQTSPKIGIGRSSSATGTNTKANTTALLRDKKLPPINASNFETKPQAPSNPTASSASSHRSGRLAREPRINLESTRDFADFIRSTGPESDPTPTLPFVTLKGLSGSTPSLPRSGSINTGKTKESGPVPRLAAPPNTPAVERPRVNMEPRAAVTPASDTADLIDFIRQGPPSAGPVGPSVAAATSRGPRAVGQPGRSGGAAAAIDSNDFKRLAERGSEASLTKTYNNSHTSHASGRTSANSRTGLLSSSSHPTHTYSGTANQHGGSNNVASLKVDNATDPGSRQGSALSSMLDELEGPTRKRYRSKDPYAIESDGEDEDLLTALPGSKAASVSSQAGRPNEPLLPLASPFVNGSTITTISAGTGDTHRNGISSTGPPAIPPKSTPPLPTTATTTSSSSSYPSRQQFVVGGIPRAPRPGGGAGAGSGRAAVVPIAGAIRGSARGGKSERTETGYLADFLRNSGPAEPRTSTKVTAEPFLTAKEKEGKSGIRFWRKRSVAD